VSGAKRAERAEALRRFKPYPAYKDSGVEWLGEIPAHWKESKVKFLGRYINGYAFKPDDWSVEGRPIIRIQNLTNPEAPINRFMGDLDPRYRVTRGDILISWSASLGLFIWSETEDAWLNQHIFKVVLHEGFDREYFVWLGDWFIRELQKETHGSTMTHLTYGMFGGFRVDLPPAQEQRSIAAFLDRETAQIDALLAKKERLIDLLQEKRTALITRAVTKGLDPNVPMKDSGVEWLGEIPAHWEVQENRWLFQESDQRSDQGDEELLTVSHITGVTRRSDKPDVTMIEAESHEGYKICEDGELAINTMWAWMGALGIANERGMVSPSYNVFRIADRRLFPGYYDYLCRIPLHVSEIIRHSKGIWQSRLRLYPDAFREIATPLPPQRERHAIVTFLDGETARIDALVAKVREAIDRLKELRTALISAAVTGKIDVRGEVA
jgi:type I restriction enzyme S subunit